MTIPARIYVDGADDELTKVGRDVVQSKMLPIAEIVNHILMWRMRNLGGACYLRDQWNVTRGLPGGTDAHTFQYRTGPTARRLRVSVLTLGAVAGTGNARVGVRTTTQAGLVYLDVIQDTAAATFPSAPNAGVLRECVTDHARVTPDSIETISIEQANSTTTVRILGINIEELPRPQMSLTGDVTGGTFLGIDTARYQAGTDIIDTDVSPGVLAENTLRRLWKKVVFSNMKFLSTDSAVYECLVGKAARTLRWNYYPSVTLPETADPANNIVIAVLGAPVGGAGPTGDVRLFTAGGTPVNVNFPNIGAAPPIQIRTATVPIPRAGSTWSYEARATGTATEMDVYGCLAFENFEPV